MKFLRQPLHRYLVELRRERDLQQTQVSQLARIDQRRLSAYETGLRNPSPAHLAALAPVLGTSVEALRQHPELWQGHSGRDAWFQDRHVFWPEFDRFGDRRLTAACVVFGAQVTREVRRLDPAAQSFLSLTPSDSSLEWRFQLHHLTGGAHPSRHSPLGIQFRRHMVIDPDTEECVGDCSVPALIGEFGTLRYVLLPKVCVRTKSMPDSPLTLDFLCGAREPGQPITHVNVEVDGLGHDSRFDQKRTRALSMKTARFTESDLRSADFMGIFHGRVLKLVRLGRTA